MNKQIETFLRNRELRRGFTLMELLIVLVIIVIMMAILIPIIWSRYKRFQVDQAQLQVNTFRDALNQYNIDTGAYPTLQQGGLQALITKPSMTTSPVQTMTNTATTPMPNTMQPQTPLFAPQGPPGQVGPGMNTGMPNMSGGMPDMMGGGMPNMSGGMPNMSGGMPNMSGGMPDMMGGGMPNMSGGMPNMSGGMPDMMGGGMPDMMGGGMGDITGGGMMPNQSAALIRAQLAATKWRGSYLAGDVLVIPLDPWGQEYNYEWPTMRTVDGSPAVWSSGPDKTLGTTDDIYPTGDSPEEVALKRQQMGTTMQGNTGLGGTGMMDPTGMGGPGMGGPGMGSTGMMDPTGMGGPGMGGTGMGGYGY